MYLSLGKKHAHSNLSFSSLLLLEKKWTLRIYHKGKKTPEHHQSLGLPICKI